MQAEASKLQSAASQTSDAGASEFLKGIAQTFQNVADGGSMTELHPFVLGGMSSQSMLNTYSSSGELSGTSSTSSTVQDVISQVLSDLKAIK